MPALFPHRPLSRKKLPPKDWLQYLSTYHVRTSLRVQNGNTRQKGWNTSGFRFFTVQHWTVYEARDNGKGLDEPAVRSISVRIQEAGRRSPLLINSHNPTFPGASNQARPHFTGADMYPMHNQRVLLHGVLPNVCPVAPPMAPSGGGQPPGEEIVAPSGFLDPWCPAC